MVASIVATAAIAAVLPWSAHVAPGEGAAAHAAIVRTTPAVPAYHMNIAVPTPDATTTVAVKRLPAATARPTAPAKTEPSVVAPPNSATTDAKKAPRALSPAEQAENAYRAGALLARQGMPTQAAERLRHALTLDPAHLAAREALAALLLDNSDSVAAHDLLVEGLALAPQHRPYVVGLVRLYADAGDAAAAVALLENYGVPRSSDTELLAYLAALYQRLERHHDAAGAYRHALEFNPMEAKWWLGLGLSLEATARWQEAREAYRRAISTGLEPALAGYAEQRANAVTEKLATAGHG